MNKTNKQKNPYELINDLYYTIDLTPNNSMFNLNTNSKFLQQMKQQRLRKSCSVVAFTTLPVEQIVFNPSEFNVGESKISRLPQRIISRRNSLATLPRTEKPTPIKQPKQREISLLKKINEKLVKDNSELRKQLQLYKKISHSNSLRGKSSYMQESLKPELNLKNIVVEKINRTKCSSRLADNDTGLYSSKEISYNTEFESISEMYDSFIKRAVKPTLLQYQEQLKKFFTDVQQTFIKLKYLFESVSRQQQVNNLSDYSKCQILLDSISDICQVKIQKQKVNKYPGLVQKSKSKCKVERQPTRQKQQEKEDVLELLSPDQVIERFEKYIQKILKSQRIIKSLKSSLIVRKLTKKLSEV